MEHLLFILWWETAYRTAFETLVPVQKNGIRYDRQAESNLSVRHGMAGNMPQPCFLIVLIRSNAPEKPFRETGKAIVCPRTETATICMVLLIRRWERVDASNASGAIQPAGRHVLKATGCPERTGCPMRAKLQHRAGRHSARAGITAVLPRQDFHPASNRQATRSRQCAAIITIGVRQRQGLAPSATSPVPARGWTDVPDVVPLISHVPPELTVTPRESTMLPFPVRARVPSFTSIATTSAPLLL